MKTSSEGASPGVVLPVEPAQDERGAFALPQREAGPHRAFWSFFERDLRREAEDAAVLPPEDGPTPADRDGVPGAGVIEGRAALELEGHLAAYGVHAAYQTAVSGTGGDRHVVEDLDDAFRREEAGEQHVGVGQVDLLAASVRERAQPEVPSLLVVQDRAEDARRIERRQAEPVYGAVPAHERRGAQVADDAMVLYRKVSHSTAPRVLRTSSQEYSAVAWSVSRTLRRGIAREVFTSVRSAKGG